VDSDADTDADVATDAAADASTDADPDADHHEGCAERPGGCVFVEASAYTLARGGERVLCLRLLEEDGHSLWAAECAIDPEGGFDVATCVDGPWSRHDIGDIRSLGGEVYHSEAIAEWPDPVSSRVLHMIGDDVELPRFYRICEATDRCGELTDCSAWRRGSVAHELEGALASFFVHESGASRYTRFLELGFDERGERRVGRTCGVDSDNPWADCNPWSALELPDAEGADTAFVGAGGFVYLRREESTGELVPRSVQLILDRRGRSSWWRECPLEGLFFQDEDCAPWAHHDLSELG
jgi:hypothetical protein